MIRNLPKIELLPFGEITESRPVLLITSSPAWNAVKDRLNLPLAGQVEVTAASLEHWQALGGVLSKSLQQLAIHHSTVVIYAVGGGLVADAAKYLAHLLEVPLICLPTALTVDAFFTWASGIRQAGCVRYLETKPPDLLIVDLDVIASAPPILRSAGITDVLSIATGSWDWRFAHQQNQNPAGMEYLPYIDSLAQSVLQSALDCAEAAGRGDPQGLKQLLDCLALEVQLCNQVGHSRPEEGSEHYFAYTLENLAGHGIPHGDLVAPGILVMARLQGQDTKALERALHYSHVPVDRFSQEMIHQTLGDLPGYCQKHNLPFGIAHTLSAKQVDSMNFSFTN